MTTTDRLVRAIATRRVPSLGAAALLAALAAGCLRPVPISQVRERSAELQGKAVTVEGTVSERVDLPLLRDRFYRLEDGTGTIWVQTAQASPGEGERVRVTGTLGPGLRVPGLDVGLLIVETRRR
jgi:hypothetical protein